MRLLLVALSSAVIALQMISSASGASVVPMDFAQIVDLATIVFAGTVESIDSEWTPDHTTIVTHVRFADVIVAKGTTEAKPVVLTLRGGTVGKERVVAFGQLEFHPGERCIVFAFPDLGSERDSYLPIVGLWQGCFVVKSEKPNAPRTVHTWQGAPVVGLEGGRLVVVGPPEGGEGQVNEEHLDTRVVPERRRRFAGERARGDSSSHRREVRVLPPPSIPPATLLGSTTESKVLLESGPSIRPDIRRSDHPVVMLAPRRDSGIRLSESAFLSLVRQLAARH